MIDVKNRDNNIDILRGFATVLVVLGHTMTGSTINSEESLFPDIRYAYPPPE